jgi:hypothetical protein
MTRLVMAELVTLELGQTGDPRALIPGAPETIEADAAALAGHGKCVEQVGQNLRTIDVGDWRGDAGTRFAEVWAAEPPKWLKVADAVGLAATALSGYAGILRWAQGQAAAAIELWGQAAATTDRAAAEFQRAEDAARGRCQWIEPFVDPGEELRRDAQDLLARARDRLRAAGDEAARAIGGSGIGRPFALPGLPGGPLGGPLHTLVEALTGSASASGSFAAGWLTGDGKAGFTGLNAGAETSGPEFDLAGGELTLGELKAHAHLFDADASGSLHAGDLIVTGAASASEGADLEASAGLSKDGLAANLEASAGLRATAAADARYGIVGVHANGEGFVGADGELGLNVTKDKIGVDAEGFAGGRLTGDLGADVAGLGAGVHGEAWAGVGAELKAGAEFKDGKFHLGGHVGAAVGVGGSVGFDITIDPEEVGRTAMEAADAIGHGLDDAGEAIGAGLDDAGEAIGHGLDGAGDAIGGLAHHIGL